MPRMTFTDRGIKALKPQAVPVDYWSTDPKERGFGIRVWPGGSKSWFVYTRKTGDGRPKRITVGTFPDKGLAKAREEAGDERARVRGGADPAAEHRAERATRRETVKALFDAYCTHVERQRQAGKFRSWPDLKRSFERDVLPAWGDRPVKSIRRRDVKELVAQKALTGAVAANRLQAHVSMLFSYALVEEWIDANPAAGLRKEPERPRDRVLSADEIKALWTFLDGDTPMRLSRGVKADTLITMPEATAATLRELFKVLVLTGQRLGETSKMKWADVDLDARVWTIPATETKNRTAHRVPLSRQVVNLLKVRQERGGVEDFVFPSAPGSEHAVLVWSKRTAAAIATVIKVPFTAHDLRRSLASGLGELGISTDVIGLVLNHRKPGVTARHYDLSRRETAERDALQAWADHVEAILTGKAGKVITMRQRKGGAR